MLNIFIWLFFHLSISLGLLKLPYSWFDESHQLNRLFIKRPFEKEGKLWRQTFKVHKWKDILPDGASLFNTGYKKKKLPEAQIDSLEVFIKETKRAELTHVLLLFPAPLFYLWNPLWAGHLMIVYALAVNVPFIIIQRYNRIRLGKIVHLLRKKSG
ncbi:MAG: glycosyl-4,4'-diaponeurosporenoate acyltransferase [Alkalibacterium sp.]|nr:glycosyl-4,4'-diaponeurosporenoate acyltransferase [Alkalibacterium sp.]